MRQFLLVTIKILISGALLYLALRGVNVSAILTRVNQISLGWILVAIVVTLVQILLGALRWREISVLCAAPLTAAQALRFNMIGSFFNQTLPSSIGGDAVRLWLVNRTGAGWRAATYSVLVDRAIGLVALAILIATFGWQSRPRRFQRGRRCLMSARGRRPIGPCLPIASTRRTILRS